MDHSNIAEHVSHLGLDDAFSAQLAHLLANCDHPVLALQRCRWTIPPQDELEAMAPEVRAVALVPVVSIVVSTIAGQLKLSWDFREELIGVGCSVLGTLPNRWRDESLAPVRNYRNHAWKAIYRQVSARTDALTGPQVAWCNESGEPLGGRYPVEPDGIYFPTPFNTPDARNWDGISPALRSLFDCCQDDTDRAIIKARWADGRCVTEGYVTSLGAIAGQLILPEAEVLERLHRLRHRWRCYINRTQRFTKHLPALPIRQHIST